MNNFLVNPQKRFWFGVILVGFFVFFFYAINIIRINIHWDQLFWAPKNIIPAINPVGIDYRLGWYDPARLFLKSGSIGNTVYPPLVTALALPLSFFEPTLAYAIHIGLLFVANISILFLSAYLVHKIVVSEKLVAQENQPFVLIGLYIIAGLIGFMDIGSYGFLFSIERGNYDIFAMFMSVLSIYFLICHPKKIWIQVIFLSIATHLKIYPMILFLPLFWRHRWKLIVPSIVVNTAFLFVLGPANALLFVKNLQQFMGDPYLWIGNHSAYSFFATVSKIIPEMAKYYLFFKVLPLVIWMLTVVGLFLKKYSSVNVLLLYIISIPIMSLFPDVSHDYKLVIFYVSLFLMITLLLLIFQKTGKIIGLIVISLMLLDFMFISQSYAVLPELLGNKFPFLLLFEGLVFLIAPYISCNLNGTQEVLVSP